LKADDSGGIPYPHQLAGMWLFWDTGPDIADADRSILSWTRPPESTESDRIGVDWLFGEPAYTGGEVTSVPTTAEGADGVLTDAGSGWW
jgi:hypothetical protein